MRSDGSWRSGPATRLAARVGALLVVAVALDRSAMHLTRLPEADYARPVLVAAFGERLVSWDPIALAALLVVAAGLALALRHRSLGSSWTDWEHGTRLRALALVAAGLLAWVHATYAYNLYLGRAHALDRLLLVALVPLIGWRPVAILPFLGVLLVVEWQFAVPLGGHSWAAPLLPIQILFLMAAFWLVRLARLRVRTADLVFLVCCLIAAHYWVSGFGKLRLGWPFADRIAFLLPATYANGWLGFLDADQVARLTGVLSGLNLPMKLGTIVLEVGALCALARRNVLRAFLVGWPLLHVGVFLVTGIFFWQWMLLELAVLLLFFRAGSPDLPIFGPGHFVLSLVVIGGGLIWFRPTELAWLDARATYTYRFEAHGESGRTYSLSPRFFAPYDYQFTLGNFRYLSAAPHLPITWGATGDRRLAAELTRASTPEAILELERAFGRDAFDAGRSARFDDFVRRFVAGWNERAGGGDAPGFPRAPPLLWTFASGRAPDPADPITRVVVYQVTSLYDDERYLEIRRRAVRTIDIPPSGRVEPAGARRP